MFTQIKRFVLLQSLAALLAVAIASTAGAAPILGFDSSGSGNFAGKYADIWTMATDTGMAFGVHPGQSVSVGNPGTYYNTTFWLQGEVDVATLNGSHVAGVEAGMGSTFELTFEAKLNETVVNQAIIPGLGETIMFASGEDPTSTVAWYVDDLTALKGGTATKANRNGISGYGDDDGIGAVMTAHLLKATTQYTAFSQTSGLGAFTALFKIDTVNSAYINATVGEVYALNSTGTVILPAAYHPTTTWDGTTSTQGAVLMRMDGSQTFVTPEPGTFLLMGFGLAGLGWLGASRKRKS